jgi:hypothetical protein
VCVVQSTAFFSPSPHFGLPLQGALLSHGAVVATIASQRAFEFSVPGGGISPDDCYISYLPLAHIFDRLVALLLFFSFFLFATALIFQSFFIILWWFFLAFPSIIITYFTDATSLSFDFLRFQSHFTFYLFHRPRLLASPSSTPPTPTQMKQQSL